MPTTRNALRLAIATLIAAVLSISGVATASTATAYPLSSMGLEFVTTVPNETVEIGFGGELQNVIIDWGDGEVDHIPNGTAVPDAFYSHQYPVEATYVAVISATTLSHFGKCVLPPNNWTLKRILSWGTLNTTSFECAAWSRTALTSIPTNIPSTVTDISRMFYDTHVFNQNLSAWDTSHVTTMDRTFGSTRGYDQSLGSWNISNVTNLDYMFGGALGFGDTAYSNTLIGWATQNVHPNLLLGSLLAKASGCDAIEARNTLLTAANWTISDSAPTQSCSAQTVTWGPTNTSAQIGTLTPNAMATGSDFGAITYAVSDAGTSGCAVNATSGAITGSSPGICVVRANSAATPGFFSGSTTVSFVFTAATLAATGGNALGVLVFALGGIGLGIIVLLVIFIVRRRKL